MQYNLEPFNLLKKLSPAVLKKLLFKELLKVLATGLTIVNDAFLAFVAHTKHRIKHNGQVICLEAILNLEFPTADIFIVDNMDQLPPIYIHQRNEVPEVFIYPQSYQLPYDQVYLYTQYEYDNMPDFIVYCKQALYDAIILNNEIERFKALINERKIVGKIYVITPY